MAAADHVPTRYTCAAVGPLLTSDLCRELSDARRAGAPILNCSVDLQLSVTAIGIGADTWTWRDRSYPYPAGCKERTIYHWTDRFEPVSRYSSSLIKLIPTDWGPPTFEIDGIKMLPTARLSPYADAERKVNLIQPRDKVVLDTCGGLGYFAAWCVRGRAARVMSFEKSTDVIWLRGLNPWSPAADNVLSLTHADVAEAITGMADDSVDAVLHDPPRFGIAGELYSQTFYDHLARILKRRGRLFHYTGSPNKASSGRDLAQEVTRRLRQSGFSVDRDGDGLIAINLPETSRGG
jgi:predicted methyltransferase